MKKILLSLGTITAVVAPIASVVACGSTQKVEQKADVVISFDINELNKEELTTNKTELVDSLKNIETKFKEINEDTKSIELEILDDKKSLIDVTIKFGEGLKAVKDKILKLQSVLVSEMKTLIPEILPKLKEVLTSLMPQITSMLGPKASMLSSILSMCI